LLARDLHKTKSDFAHNERSNPMALGSKEAYTNKQKRQAEHIEKSYESRGVPEGEAARRAWATVNKETGGGKKSGSGRGHSVSHVSSRKGGRLGGHALSKEQRSVAAKKGWATRRRRAGSNA
jgi:plasmid stabilization system protein ParE